jgi:PKHD-type hydroxylase
MTLFNKYNGELNMANKGLSGGPTSDQEFDNRRAKAMNGTFVMGFPACFTGVQIDELRSLVDQQNAPGGINSLNSPLDKIRRSDIRRLDHKQFHWVYDAAWTLAKKANEKYRFDIKPIRETAQLAIYDESVQGHYTWHTDCSIECMTRKISISIPLSSPAEYEGGELQVMTTDAIALTVMQQKGCPIVFPSFEMHRVTPVTKGRRYSLVISVAGPHWR